MDKIRIAGGNRLNGTIPISGAKNAALPLMIASLLTEDTLTLENVPRLRDVNQLIQILSNHGVDFTLKGKKRGDDLMAGQTFDLSATGIVDTTAPYELVSKMRASFWVIGPLVSRMGEARVSLPGGCAIGTRPVDFFIEGLRELGAEVEIDAGYVVATAKRGLQGGRVVFPKVSVGATHTILMAASLAKGETKIENAACEPEIIEVAECLKGMGAKIEGMGTPTIHVQGVDELSGHVHEVIPDRIETGTYAMAVGMTGGEVLLEGARIGLLDSVIDTLRTTGIDIESVNGGVMVRRNGQGVDAANISTSPFPGFPTDLQAQFMALMTKANGSSKITETIFENRFMHVQELARLGADITLDGQVATVEGVKELEGAPVMATDLRASVSLVIAALVAKGETTINRVYHLDRGFEQLDEKLRRCGATIERISG